MRYHKGNKYALKHGEAKKTPEYRSWAGMKSRCNVPSDINYKNYGERGIRVCVRWIKSYPAFLQDMGRKPGLEYSLDRINVNGNYTPKNCRWATSIQQANNTRKQLCEN